MYSGGKLLGTFDGPGENGEIITVSGSAKTGRYVLIQMDKKQVIQDEKPLNLHEVMVFGKVSRLRLPPPITITGDCQGSLELDVVNSDQGGRDDMVHNLFNQDENEWLADEGTTADQGFVLQIRGCKRNLIGLRIKNAAQPWASKRFKVFGGIKHTGPWIDLVEGELEETNAIQTFHFSQLVEVQFLRFELLSYFSQKGGGLSFFSPLEGSPCIAFLTGHFPTRFLPKKGFSSFFTLYPFCISFHKISSECQRSSNPDVIWSTSYRKTNGNVVSKYRIEGIFTVGGKYWLTNNRYTGHGFTIKLNDCRITVAGVRIKNVAHVPTSSIRPTRSTKGFRVSGVLKDSGPWEELLEEEFEDALSAEAPTPTVQTFYFKEAVEVQFLRFDLDSYWGDVGGGLDYFGVITVSGDFLFYFNVCNFFKQTSAVQLNRTVLPFTVDPLLLQ